MTEKKKKSNNRMSINELMHDIVSLFNAEPNKLFNYKQVAHALGLKLSAQRQKVYEILSTMAQQEFLVEPTPGRFKKKDRGTRALGLFERRSNGKNQVVTEEGEEIFVAERNSMHALDGDKVEVYVYARRRHADPEGEVTQIIERADRTFVGILSVEKQYAFLITDSKTLANDIFIPKNKLRGGKDGEKAVVRITEWPEHSKNPIGEVIDVLGEAGDNNTEMHAILAEFGLPYKYPEAVEKAADKISDIIPADEIARREDFREVTTFTIDPHDAKDFDDAISIRQLPSGLWEVGVHIADVTHYVQPGSIIDKEAERRATSVYLVDRTIPMLPERLCNYICSLRPDEDKLAFSCIFEIDDNANIKRRHIARTIIRSNRRYAYEEAQAIIEGADGDFRKEILVLNDLAQKMRKRRFENGSISFDRQEVRFEIDEEGHPIRVYFKIAKEANMLIEEFMLLANCTVAEAVGKTANGKKAKSFVYRVHDQPDPSKINDLASFITRFGYRTRLHNDTRELSKNINKLMQEIKGRPEENLISTVAIRSMSKAIYSTDNIGHYGLGFDYYTHFTSPIRRYPDMMVHRLIDRYLNGGRSAVEQSLESKCKHSSEMEQLAANAERASIKYKQVEFLSDRLGEEFDGVISGITEWGLYVELDENKCEGLIPIRELDDDYYELDEKNYALVGRRSHRIYRLGDPVRILIAGTNLEKKQLDFALVRTLKK
ncbi:MAG: ribonuclease R [Bacteroidaceae bacterium]|nr:ribonuclease R [Bacteroidaceae bacterium]